MVENNEKTPDTQAKAPDAQAKALADIQAELATAQAKAAAMEEAFAEVQGQLAELKAAKSAGSVTVGVQESEKLPDPKPFKLGTKKVAFRYVSFFDLGKKVLEKDLTDADRVKYAERFPGLVKPVE